MSLYITNMASDFKEGNYELFSSYIDITSSVDIGDHQYIERLISNGISYLNCIRYFPQMVYLINRDYGETKQTEFPDCWISPEFYCEQIGEKIHIGYRIFVPKRFLINQPEYLLFKEEIIQLYKDIEDAGGWDNIQEIIPDVDA